MANKKICFKQTFQLLKDLMSVYFTLKNTRILVNKTLKLKKSTGMYSTQMKTQMINFCKINHNGNLYKAIHEEFHYDVEIEVLDQKRKIKTKKHTYIR